MPSAAVKERLAQDVALWQADGLIDDSTKNTLAARYDTPGFGLLTLVKYLGIAGGLLAAFGLLGFFAALAESKVFGTMMALGVAAFFLWAGLKLSLDPLARYVHSSKIVLALGVVAFAGGVLAIGALLDFGEATETVLVGIVCLPVSFVLAYQFHNLFLLLLSVMGFFHWVGAWDGMLGRNTYAFDVQDPKVMSVVAAATVAFGIVHERAWADRWPRFHQVFQTVALIYLNLSLLILSIYPSETALPWIAVLTLASIAQMVVGARIKSGLLMGFGVTAMAVNFFTRYFERFWDALDAGVFFLVGGVVLLGVGLGLEAMLKQRRAEARP